MINYVQEYIPNHGQWVEDAKKVLQRCQVDKRTEHFANIEINEFANGDDPITLAELDDYIAYELPHDLSIYYRINIM